MPDKSCIDLMTLLFCLFAECLGYFRPPFTLATWPSFVSPWVACVVSLIIQILGHHLWFFLIAYLWVPLPPRRHRIPLSKSVCAGHLLDRQNRIVERVQSRAGPKIPHVFLTTVFIHSFISDHCNRAANFFSQEKEVLATIFIIRAMSAVKVLSC